MPSVVPGTYWLLKRGLTLEEVTAAAIIVVALIVIMIYIFFFLALQMAGSSTVWVPYQHCKVCMCQKSTPLICYLWWAASKMAPSSSPSGFLLCGVSSHIESELVCSTNRVWGRPPRSPSEGSSHSVVRTLKQLCAKSHVGETEASYQQAALPR